MKQNTNRLNLWDRIMTAITFAEAGEAETAIEFLEKKTNEQRPETRIRKNEQRPELRV